MGFWKNDRRNGQGKTVRYDRKKGEWVTEEGLWENDKLLGNDKNEEI